MNNLTYISCSDLQELHEVVQGIVGRKCWKVAFTYGGELTLHFGRRLTYPTGKMGGKKTGEWRLGTRGTAWALFTPQGGFSSREKDEKALEQKAKVLEERVVTDFSVSLSDNALTITFGSDYLFRVIPTARDAKGKLPYWELLMPYHQIITFGPGNSWSRRRSDVPLSSLNGTTTAS